MEEHHSFALASHTCPDYLLLNVFLKGERARSNSHPQATFGKIMFCHNEGSTRETETSMVLEDPNFSIIRVKGMVVQSLLSINLLRNRNFFVIFFCASDGSVAITASQQKAMICEMPRQPTIPSLRNSALPGEFCGSQAGEKSYPAVCQPSFLENKNFAGPVKDLLPILISRQ